MDDTFQVKDEKIEKSLREIGEIIKAQLPAGVGFTLFMFDIGDEGGMFYLSSAERTSMLKALREFISNQEGKTPMVDLAKRMNAQDNRSTQLPLFVVQEKYEDEWVFNLQAGVFLTGEACDNHIRTKSYRYAKEVRSYGISACNSYEMAEVLEYLSALPNGIPAPQYKA